MAGRPNVLFIVADDLNAWIGALGRHPDVRTPHIDALADRGTLFTHAYCAAPYCHSSRMSCFTGRQPTTLGIFQEELFDWQDEDRPRTFIELLHDHGYHTAGAGKVFHGSFDYSGAHEQGLPAAPWTVDRGNQAAMWDEFALNEADPLPPGRPLNGLYDHANPGIRRWQLSFDWGPVGSELEAELPDRHVTDAVTAFLASGPPEPFFCAAGLYRPHLPWFVPARYFDLYPPRRIALPAVKRNPMASLPPAGRRFARGRGEHRAVVRSGQWRPAVAAYLAAITYCDDLVGEMVAALDASGLAERTTVVLLGDNGFHLGEKLHWRKFALWEEATQVPLVMTGPGLVPGRRVHQPVGLIDVFPTLLEQCGVPVPDGHDATPLPLGPGPFDERPPVVSTWLTGNHSVRSARWRYIRYADGGEELYDHGCDPNEWVNLAGKPACRPVMDDLARWLPADLPADGMAPQP